MGKSSIGGHALKFLFFISTLLFILSSCAEEEETGIFSESAEEHEGSVNGSAAHHSMRYKIAQLDWTQVRTPYTIALWILLASVAKIGFHLSKKFASIFPDSSLLIVLGLLVGLILFFIKTDESKYHLSSKIFFLYLLPPIVFDAGYFMPNRPFFDNLGTILVYAVFGTLWNTITIGLSLYAVSLTGIFSYNTPLLHSLTFSSLVSAVDPVAVLVVFEDIQVNAMLYITVFGESLLNDAVTVVLYEMFESFSHIGQENLIPIDIVSGFIAFFVVSLGGVIIGIIWALICSFTTKFTKHVRVIEPQVILLMAYLSYLTAQMLHLSAILAIVFCGIFMKQYVEENISTKSKTTVQYLLKMVCTSCETIIFMFLGLSTVTRQHGWDLAFVALTVLFCLVYRAIGVVILTFFVNKKRLIKLTKVDQFIMSYGGLRGAIAYGLVSALDEDIIPAKKMFVTTTIVVIYFTVFLQGMTIKPLVNFLKVKKEEHLEPSMCSQIFGRNIDHLVAGVEAVIGAKGHHWRRAKFESINEHFIKPLLLRNVPPGKDTSITKVFTELNMKAAMDHVEKFGTFHSELNLAHEVNLANGALKKYPLYPGEIQKLNGSEKIGYSNLAYTGSTDDLDNDDVLEIPPELTTIAPVRRYSRDITDDAADFAKLKRNSVKSRVKVDESDDGESPRNILKEKLNPMGRRYSRDIDFEPSPMPVRRHRLSNNSGQDWDVVSGSYGNVPEAHSAMQARRRSLIAAGAQPPRARLSSKTSNSSRQNSIEEEGGAFSGVTFEVPKTLGKNYQSRIEKPGSPSNFSNATSIPQIQTTDYDSERLNLPTTLDAVQLQVDTANNNSLLESKSPSKASSVTPPPSYTSVIEILSDSESNNNGSQRQPIPSVNQNTAGGSGSRNESVSARADDRVAPARRESQFMRRISNDSATRFPLSSGKTSRAPNLANNLIENVEVGRNQEAPSLKNGGTKF